MMKGVYDGRAAQSMVFALSDAGYKRIGPSCRA